jgi:dUTP pyrophosphatase
MRVKLLRPEAKLPAKVTPGAAGYDLYSPVFFSLPPLCVQRVLLGISLELEPGQCFLIRDRSSIASRGIFVVGGVVDSDYRGEVAVCLYNGDPYGTAHFACGERIAQGLLLRPDSEPVYAVEVLSETTRGSGGFGSTGRGEIVRMGGIRPA